MKGKLTPYALLAALVIAADQATKAWVQHGFALYESRPVVQGWFHLTYIRNRGAAFGLFSQQAEAFRRPFFLAVTALALIVLLVVAVRTPRGRPWLLSALALVFGGAVGNLIDRLRWGEVVDFLDVFWRSHHWPAFNVADSAICVGMGILVAAEVFAKDRHRPPT